MNRTRIDILMMLVCIAFSSSATAEWYHVELIVFENINSASDSEDMYKDPGLSPLNGTVKLVYDDQLVAETETASAVPLAGQVTDIPLVPYKVLPESSYKLQGVYQALRQSREYRPQYHIAWQQPGYDGNMARAVHLQQEDGSRVFESTLPETLVADPLPAEFYEPVKLLVDGTVRLRSSAFLYVNIDMMVFRPPVDNTFQVAVPAQAVSNYGPAAVPEQAAISASSTERPASYVRLSEARRIKLNDLQYFDHPRFGVILQVSRLVDVAETIEPVE